MTTRGTDQKHKHQPRLLGNGNDLFETYDDYTQKSLDVIEEKLYF